MSERIEETYLVAWPPAEAEPASPGCLEAVGYVVLIHAWMALHVAMVFGALGGVMYALVPPLPVFAMLMQAPSFTRFALWSGCVCIALLAITWRVINALRGHRTLPRADICGWLLPVLTIWAPVLAGEIVSRTAIAWALAEAKPDCHGARGLLPSLRDYAGSDFPVRAHAWMIRGATRYIWSYREMAFVIDTRPLDAGETCRQVTRS